MIQEAYFVYGTLRPGFHNQRWWQGRADATFDGYATVPGYRLVTQGSFPYAVPDCSEAITGCILLPRARHARDLMRSLDALEGHPDHYQRTEVVAEVRYTDLSIPAWLYVAVRDCSHLHEVPNNDWADYQKVRPYS